MPVSALSKIELSTGIESISTSFQKWLSLAKSLSEETISDTALISSGNTRTTMSAMKRIRNRIDRNIEMLLLWDAMKRHLEDEICFSRNLAGMFMTKATHIPPRSGTNTAAALSAIQGRVVL